MRTQLVLLSATAILCSTTTQALTLKGVAKSLDGKTTLYTELHQIVLDDKGENLKIDTSYAKPNGEVFAKMTSDFSKNKTVPIIFFEDLRLKKKEELTFSEDGKTITLKLVKNGKAEEKNVPIKENMVVGQGFDNFVKINFEKLIKKSIGISFGVLAKLDFFNFTAKFRGETKETSNFGINIDNVFLKLFLSELQVEYDTKTKQLVRYKGLSNLVSDSGDDQNVLIDYEKPTP
jgi:hypothetical protein